MRVRSLRTSKGIAALLVIAAVYTTQAKSVIEDRLAP